VVSSEVEVVLGCYMTDLGPLIPASALACAAAEQGQTPFTYLLNSLCGSVLWGVCVCDCVEVSRLGACIRQLCICSRDGVSAPFSSLLLACDNMMIWQAGVEGREALAIAVHLLHLCWTQWASFGASWPQEQHAAVHAGGSSLDDIDASGVA
jgi:hypothetical protein